VKGPATLLSPSRSLDSSSGVENRPIQSADLPASLQHPARETPSVLQGIDSLRLNSGALCPSPGLAEAFAASLLHCDLAPTRKHASPPGQRCANRLLAKARQSHGRKQRCAIEHSHPVVSPTTPSPPGWLAFPLLAGVHTRTKLRAPQQCVAFLGSW
jgi:hypothetical protein